LMYEHQRCDGELPIRMDGCQASCGQLQSPAMARQMSLEDRLPSVELDALNDRSRGQRTIARI
jgi:hypothetical protein